MNKIFIKSLFLLIAFTVFVYGRTNAQTITTGSVDVGPYAPGSSITAPFTVTGACLNTKTTYSLYLSNAGGSFAAQKLIGVFSDFYGTFVNGVIPAGTPAGNGYELKVVATSPSSVINAISTPFSINATGGVLAAVGSELIDPPNPEVFGACNGVNNTSYNFVDQSTAGSTVTATFFNELTQASEGTITPTTAGTSFVAKAAHYTITVKAVNSGIVGTKSYLLVNNSVNTSFGVTGSNTICLSAGGTLTYNVDISSPSGIQNNFPGLTYNIKWGDGATSALTLCDILASGGKISHNYTQSSCGNNPNGQNNSFEVDLQPTGKYCGKVGTQVTSYAQVVTAPLNNFTGPITVCNGGTGTYTNTSDPGQDPNSVSGNCKSTTVLYTWSVDGTVAASNYSLAQKFTTTFNTPGLHTITLHLQNGNALCTATDFTVQVCVQNPPQPKFSLSATTGCAPATITPNNQSVIDANCNTKNEYLWTATGPAAVTYAGGTNQTSAQPQFVFSTAGVYQISLGITTATCGSITSPTQTVVIDAPIAISLSPDASLCGTKQTLSFSPAAGPAQTTITGIGQAKANTYKWTVTGGAFSFAGGTTANSQYPQITFTDFATYNISVTVQNNCGTLTQSQKITFQNAPTVAVVPSATPICPGSSVTLKGSITGSYTSFKWVGSGTFSAPAALTTIYTPTAAEINAGSATVILDVTTALVGQCADVQQSAIINIYPVNNITSTLAQQTCTGNSVNYQNVSSVTGSTFTWTAALTSGTATGFKNGAGADINDVLVNTGAGDAVISYTITPKANGCTGNPSVLTVTVKLLSAVVATPASATICSGTAAEINLTPTIAGTTYTWTSTTTGSITGNTQQATAVSTPAINDIITNNSSSAIGTVTYIVTPVNGICPGPPTTVTITIQPAPITSKPGNNDEICNSTSYVLNGNNPAPAVGKWTVSPAGGVTFNNSSLPNATANGLIPGNTYTFTWTITPAAPCPANSNSITVIDDTPTVGGTTDGGATVCAGSNGGNITLSGQNGSIARWESSTDNGTTWTNVFNTTTTLAFVNLTTTTNYRALVQNGVCSNQYSSVATVVVNQPAKQAIAGSAQSLCGATTASLQGNDPSPFKGQWTQTAGPAANILTPNSPQTQLTGLLPGNDYTFVWTIFGLPPCANSSDMVQIHDANDVTPGFTADKADGCGDYTVNFTNTSTVLTGTSFLWDFGDGSPQSTDVSPSHLFAARTDGKDVVYTVTLNVINNCLQRPPFTLKVTVRPQTPVAYIAPQQITGCSPFTLTVDNLSPGNNVSYTYYLYLGATEVQQITKTDVSEVSFSPITVTSTKVYSLYMVATGTCGNTGQSSIIPISVTTPDIVAQLFLNNGVGKGCAPFTATFINNSIGGDTYTYNIFDTNNVLIDSRPAGSAPYPYTFNIPGTYYVSITATNSCGQVTSNTQRVDVYPLPAPQFTADVTTGCKNITVNFTNQTADDPTIQAKSLLYDWDFGDGSPHSVAFTPPPHVYTFKNSPFTVTLTATNPVTSCSNVVSQPGYINVTAPPATDFTEKPDSVTSIPNYTFSFIDETTNGPTLWQWTFGDGQNSLSQNPTHTYIDTGLYKVTLTTADASGCDSTISHHVRITGVPGQLFLPNAFEPDGGTVELKTFMAKGSGMKEWKLQIFNNYSQLVWETTRLDEKGAPVDGWDGTFKGTPLPQGVYIWQASAKFINGTEWKGNVIKNSLPKRVGTIHLIR